MGRGLRWEWRCAGVYGMVVEVGWCGEVQSGKVGWFGRENRMRF